jgi:hypothetical protein
VLPADTLAQTRYVPSETPRGDVTENVVVPVAPGDSVNDDEASDDCQPTGTERTTVNVVGAHALPSLFVRLTE